MSDPKPWSNKVAVVTGGASGIGEATAAQFAKGGATVIVLDRVAATSAGVISIGCDVSVSSDIGAAAARIGKEFGRVTALVNSAGIQRYGTGVTTTEALWDEVMAVNLKSMFLSFRAFFPLMKEIGGAVVNVSSVQALGALPNSLAYVTSKHAVAGLTRALAIDHAVDNIRVNCVLPGSVDTPMLQTSIRGAQGLGGN
jgi:NAD(P)-dependent dehydrogenase (short-subunit alcohol dehydrogenase family)